MENGVCVQIFKQECPMDITSSPSFPENKTIKTEVEESDYSWYDVQDQDEEEQPSNYEGDCEICFKTFATKESLRNHMTKMHPLKCEHCENIFASRKQLNQHCSEEHATQERKCQACNQTLDNQDLLDRHMATDHLDLKCQICEKFSPHKEALRKHLALMHPMKCEHCNEAFVSKRQMDQHCLEEHPDFSQKCHVCNEVLNNKSFLETHMATIHKYFQCEICDKFYASRNSLRSHVSFTHILKMKCRMCDEAFITKTLLNQHFLEKHATEHLKCQVCSLVLDSENLLQSHLITIHKYLQCKLCPKLFHTKNALKSHTARRHPLKCEHCGESFPSKKMFDKHGSEKHATQQQKCHVCSKLFPNRGKLDAHIATVHKYLLCQICNNFYANKDSLRSHVTRRHGLKCDICGESFKVTYLLNEHYSEKHKQGSNDGDSKPVPSISEDVPQTAELEESMVVDSIEIGKYECDQCSCVFDDFHELEVHKKQHIQKFHHLNDNTSQASIGIEETQRFSCSICDAVFEVSDDLERHSKSHIKKEPFLS